MVRHIVMWKFKDGLTDEERAEGILRMKHALEGLKEKIEGVLEIKVQIPLAKSSDFDIILNSLFESEETLDAYQIHSEHVKAGEVVRSVAEGRKCIDFEEIIPF